MERPQDFELHGGGGRDGKCNIEWLAREADTLDARCVALEEADRVLREDHRQLLARVVRGLRDGSLRLH